LTAVVPADATNECVPSLSVAPSETPLTRTEVNVLPDGVIVPSAIALPSTPVSAAGDHVTTGSPVTVSASLLVAVVLGVALSILFSGRDGRKREPMAAYWFGGLEGRLLRLGESGLMSMIG
jgi:hypothetical protein